MPTRKNTTQATGSDLKPNRQNAVRKSIHKAPGTRVGTLQDWRGADNNSGKVSGRHGNSIRDGR
jgi:hypothetical protein